MKATLMLLGACILAPFAGGLAGASINTVPLTSAGDPLATIPQHESNFAGDIPFGGFDIPDHYPLVTRHGTIPVEELFFHGALGRRYYPYAPAYAGDGGADAGPGPSMVEDAPAPPRDEGAAQRAVDISGLSPLDPPVDPAAGLVPADPGLPSAARGMLTSAALPAGGADGALALAQ